MRGEKRIVAARPDPDTFVPLGHIPLSTSYKSGAQSSKLQTQINWEIPKVPISFFQQTEWPGCRHGSQDTALEG